jgi:peptidyl-dipeptidase Dcp
MNVIARKGLPVLFCAGLLCFPLQTSRFMTANTDNSSIILETNPLLQPWKGGYGGVPAFDKAKPEHFVPAFEIIRKKKLDAINTIATDPRHPDFNNTIVPLERAKKIVDDFDAYFGVFSGNLTTPEFQSVETTLAPQIAALEDEVIQNEKLFARIESIYKSGQQGFNPEQKRLVWLYYTDFIRSGAKLDPASKIRVKEINSNLADLFTKFQQNVLADEEQYLVLEKESDLAGLPDFFIEAIKSEAEELKLNSKWVITNTRSSIDPFLTYSENRSLREKAWRMFVNRGDNANKNNNNKIITEILQLRKERANLLGFKTHAHWRLDNTMAKTPENAMKLLEELWIPAVKRVKEEVADMQAIADQEHRSLSIEPWDYHYYMEKVRKDRFDFDQNELKPYLELDKLREGMFFVAEKVFGLKFIPVKDVPVFHPDVQVWKVQNITKNTTVGLWYFDPFARKNKVSGAWMNAIRDQDRMDSAVTTIVTNNSNFMKGRPGEPVLISWDDAVTLFHEFGHALHGLSSNVTYPSLSGTNVLQDYVEFPSQLLERWLSTPEVRTKYMTHYKTGAPMPQSLVEKLEKASTFKQGYATVEYLSSALVDMKLHLLTETDVDPVVYEKETLKTLGMPREIVMRHRTPQFLHIFSSDEYSAGYYSYIWAEVITADAWDAFTEAGSGFDKTVSERLRNYVFSVGNTIDPTEAYRKFRGRDPEVRALMEKRGFTAD